MFKIISRYVYTDIFEIIDSADCYDEAVRLKHEYELALCQLIQLRQLKNKSGLLITNTESNTYIQMTQTELIFLLLGILLGIQTVMLIETFRKK